MTALLEILALIVLAPIAGSVVLGLIGSIMDHASATEPEPDGGWLLSLLYFAYFLGVMAALGVVIQLFRL